LPALSPVEEVGQPGGVRSLLDSKAPDVHRPPWAPLTVALVRGRVPVEHDRANGPPLRQGPYDVEAPVPARRFPIRTDPTNDDVGPREQLVDLREIVGIGTIYGQNR
jgi:hypothetical protein